MSIDKWDGASVVIIRITSFPHLPGRRATHGIPRLRVGRSFVDSESVRPAGHVNP